MYPILEFTGSKYLAEIFEKIMADLARTLEVLEKFSIWITIKLTRILSEKFSHFAGWSFWLLIIF
jgi:hypothetical protein